MTGLKKIISAETIKTIRNIGSSVQERTEMKDDDRSRLHRRKGGVQNIRFIKFERANVNFGVVLLRRRINLDQI